MIEYRKFIVTNKPEHSERKRREKKPILAVSLRSLLHKNYKKKLMLNIRALHVCHSANVVLKHPDRFIRNLRRPLGTVYSGNMRKL